MSTNGPTLWNQPMFGSGGVPPVVVNGVALDSIISAYNADLVDGEGVAVETSGGQWVAHQLLEDAAAPLTMGRFEIEIEAPLVAAAHRRLFLRAPALARAHLLSLWLDRPIVDVWIGNGTRTTFVLSRSTAYGSSGVTWAQRPAECYVAGVAQTMVTAAPAAGECQLSQSADATQIVLGTAPASGAVVELSYYALILAGDERGAVEVDENIDEANAGTITLTVVERIPQRSYG